MTSINDKQNFHPKTSCITLTSKIPFNHFKAPALFCHCHACDFPSLFSHLGPGSAQDSGPSPPRALRGRTKLAFLPTAVPQSYTALEKISLYVTTQLCPLEERHPQLLVFAGWPAGRPSPLGVGHWDSWATRESEDRCGILNRD